MRTVGIRIKTIIDVIVGIVFAIIILASVAGLTFCYIDNAVLRVVIQKKNVEIEALLVSCEMDWLIKRMRPENEKNLIEISKSEIDRGSAEKKHSVSVSGGS